MRMLGVDQAREPTCIHALWTLPLTCKSCSLCRSVSPDPSRQSLPLLFLLPAACSDSDPANTWPSHPHLDASGDQPGAALKGPGHLQRWVAVDVDAARQLSHALGRNNQVVALAVIAGVCDLQAGQGKPFSRLAVLQHRLSIAASSSSNVCAATPVCSSAVQCSVRGLLPSCDCTAIP